jgi:DNA-binding transcriptional regulator GbsR (MarR family)
MAKLTPAAQKFVLHWGEMGTRWGINRTVAQIHALLYIAPKPLNAEDLVEALGVARSNVSTSLRELQGWGLVRVVHALGDRRDHFETMADVWEMFHVIVEQRKRREIDPTLVLLRECLAEAEKSGAAEAHLRQRLAALQDFFTTVDAWYQEVSRLPTAALVQLMRLGGKLRKFLGLSAKA